MGQVVDAVDPTFDWRVPIEGAPPGTWLLHYPDGTWRLRHKCKTIRQVGQVLCAPRLDPPHVVTADGPVSVGPASVACQDCGLHGWIRHGRWRPA